MKYRHRARFHSGSAHATPPSSQYLHRGTDEVSQGEPSTTSVTTAITDSSEGPLLSFSRIWDMGGLLTFPETLIVLIVRGEFFLVDFALSPEKRLKQKRLHSQRPKHPLIITL
jgi:hypothetical protein